MPRGGKRSGAGRKVSALTTKTRVIAEQAAAEGKTPLEVMLANMRHFAKVADDAEAIIEGLTAEQFTGEELEPVEQFKVLLAEVKKAAGLRMLAQQCAQDAASFMHARISPVDGTKKADDTVPLPERLKAYAREDAIAASQGKVVELAKKSAKRR